LLNVTRPIGMLGGFSYVVIEVHQFECTTRRASYKLDTKYVNGERSLNYQVLNISDIFAVWRREVYGDDNWTMYGSVNLFAIFDGMVTVLSGSQPAAMNVVSASFPDEGVPGSVLLPLPNGTTTEFALAYYAFSYNLNPICKSLLFSMLYPELICF
jgi:hypothetical protein